MSLGFQVKRQEIRQRGRFSDFERRKGGEVKEAGQGDQELHLPCHPTRRKAKNHLANEMAGVLPGVEGKGVTRHRRPVLFPCAETDKVIKGKKTKELKLSTSEERRSVTLGKERPFNHGDRGNGGKEDDGI